ncbi:MAG: ABC transporter permease [Lachnospiraceae bacterium]|nr:ABC transporter permease [Lachnospiraceae bacterium]
MFFCQLKYQLIRNFRNISVIIWLILFPVAMGLIYKLVLGNLTAQNAFSAVPAAVVERTEDNMFHMVMEGFTEGENALATFTYCDEEEALRLLKDGEVEGILVIEPSGEEEPAFSDEESVNIVGMMEQYLDTGMIPETVDFDAEGFIKDFLEGSDQEYLHAFLNSYRGGSFIPNNKISIWVRRSGASQTTIKKMAEMYQNILVSANDIAKSASEGGGNNGKDFAQAMETGDSLVKELPLTNGNTDPLASYMYNLIAMVAIFGSLVGLTIAFDGQANLSAVGARRSCSGMKKLSSILASLTGCFISEILCVFISIIFLVVVLKVDFGERLPLVYLGGIFGAAVGISLGFFVGATGRGSQGAKTGILMALNMFMLFLSGAMVPGIRESIMLYAPVINDLNPAAVICDSFYYLSMDEDLTRFFGKLVSMLLFAAVFTLLGFMLTRRKKYASL